MSDFIYNETGGLPYVIATNLGPKGDKGDVGSTRPIIFGEGVPSDSLGEEGDTYVNALNGDVYQKDSSTWGDPVANFSGPTTLATMTDTEITDVATGEILKWNGTDWINNTLAEAGVAAVGHSHTASDVTDFDTEVANNSAVTSNTAKVTNATHTGDVTGSGALTIAADAVDATNIDWGTGANQVSADDIPDGSTNVIITLTQESNFGSAYTHSSSDGTDHANVVLNDAHRVSDGKNHSDVVLNNTHRTSNGSDHSYINQNVTTTGTPTFGNTTVNGNITVTGTVDGQDIATMAGAVSSNTTHRTTTTGNPHSIAATDLSDMDITAPEDEQALHYVTSTGKWTNHEQNVDQIYTDGVGTSTPSERTLEGMLATGLSPHVMSGATITENGDGTINVAEGFFCMHQSNDATSHVHVVKVPQLSNLALTNNSPNTIYADQNGGSPVYRAKVPVVGYFETNLDEGPFSVVTRVDNDTHVLDIRDSTRNHDYQRLLRQSILGLVSYTYGLEVSDEGSLNFSIGAGAVHTLSTSLREVSAFDTSGADDFTYIYRDGASGWTRVTGQNSLVANNYDDGDGTLGTIANNRYSVHWIYVVLNIPDEIFVLYGQGSYTLAEAQEAAPPASLPPELGQFSTAVLSRKVIIAKNGTVFADIQNPYLTPFTSSSVNIHNSLSGLQGGTTDEYHHLTSAEYGALGGAPEGTSVKSTGETGGSKFLREDGDGTCSWQTPDGAGDVVGPASSTDNAITRFDSTTGKLLQDSSATINDTGKLTLTSTSSEIWDVGLLMLNPTLADSKQYQFQVGKAQATNQLFDFTFYNHTTATDNYAVMGLYGSSAITVRPSGRVSVGGYTGAQTDAFYVLGDMAITGTVDGRDVATDGTKLDGFDASTTAGDILVADGANSFSRVGIGANTHVLTSNGTTASWAAPSGGGDGTWPITITAQGNKSGAYAIDLDDGLFQTVTATGNMSLTVSNTAVGESKMTTVIITASGADRTISFDSGWDWPNAPAGDETIISSGEDLYLHIETNGTQVIASEKELNEDVEINADLIVDGSTNAAITLAQETQFGTAYTHSQVTTGNPHDVEGTQLKSTGESGGTKYLREDGDGTCSWQTISASGDVTASANMTDNTLVKGDGGSKGVQDSGVTLSDTDDLGAIRNISYTGMPDGNGNTLSDGATITPDCNLGDMMTVTLGGNRTLALPSNVKTYSSWMIEIKQDATGSRTLDTTAYKSVGGIDPVLTPTASATDILTFACFGSTSVVYIVGLNDLK